MDRVPARTAAGQVASCTAAAAHRRDHDHRHGHDTCHPHHVEVVHLGHQAVAVCHDCRTDSGFGPERQAERLAEGHRVSTVSESVLLPRLALD